jgi:hypothetical protein
MLNASQPPNPNPKNICSMSLLVYHKGKFLKISMQDSPTDADWGALVAFLPAAEPMTPAPSFKIWQSLALLALPNLLMFEKK